MAGIPDAEITYTGGIKYRICGHSIGSAFGDLDNDGHIDLFLGNFSPPPEDQDRPQFLRNRGPDGESATLEPWSRSRSPIRNPCQQPNGGTTILKCHTQFGTLLHLEAG